ncbi:MAG: SusD/RagB family nutrient-binding outer membrane lipoprotein [Bacteroidales bacterium]
MKKILISFLVLLAICGSSCTKWLDVNNNVDSPDWVEPALRLAPILSSYEGISYDLRALAPMMGYMGGSSTFATNFGALQSYIGASDNGGEAWRMVYYLQGMNLENMIDDAVKLEQHTIAGIGYAVKAYSWHHLASLHGDLPVDDAYVAGLLSHDYDNQEYAFSKVREWARLAIAELEKTDATTYKTLSTYDIVYKGNAAQWKKFAYAVLARNYITMSMKDAKYLDSAIACVNNSFTSSSDDPKVLYSATGVSTTSNLFGILRANLANVLVQSDYIVQVLTGNIPNYNSAGSIEGLSTYQNIVDTTILDPRSILLLGSKDTMPANQTDIKKGTFKFVGTRPDYTSQCNFWGLTATPNATTSGTGRWLYRDDAPWPLTSYAEMQFIKAEAQFRKNLKSEALATFKLGVAAHIDFVKSYIVAGTAVKNTAGKQTSVIGDKITSARFTTLATEYLNSKFVNNLSLADFSLSHIMMQKYVALFPWSYETWNDLRRYHYDLVLGSSGVPEAGTSWSTAACYHKLDTDASRVYKGFYLPAADVQNRRQKFATANLGSPCYRLRPRYNSEYMWNLPSLKKITPIAGDADNYHTSMVWFCIPNSN